MNTNHKIITVWEKGIGSTKYVNRYFIPFAKQNQIDEIKELFEKKTLLTKSEMPKGFLYRISDYQLNFMKEYEVEDYKFLDDEVA